MAGTPTLLRKQKQPKEGPLAHPDLFSLSTGPSLLAHTSPVIKMKNLASPHHSYCSTSTPLHSTAPGKLVTHCLQSKLHSPLPTASSPRLEPRSTVSHSGHVELDLEAAAWMLGHSLLDTPPLLALQSSPAVLAGVLLPPSPLTSLAVSGSTISNTISSTMTHQLLPSSRPRNPNAHLELPPGYLQSISKPTCLKPSP